MATSIGAQLHTSVHRYITLNRRVSVLSKEIATQLEDNCSVLDVGCGSGEIAQQIINQRKNLTLHGIDVLVRPDCVVPVKEYDGVHFPADDKSYDYVTFVDVLHHTPDPLALLREAFRVARKAVILKDHNCNSWLRFQEMRFTDWFGNGQFGVQLLFNFWSSKQWQSAWEALGTTPAFYSTDFGLYPKITRLIFAADMDFIAKLPVPTK